MQISSMIHSVLTISSNSIVNEWQFARFFSVYLIYLCFLLFLFSGHFLFQLTPNRVLILAENRQKKAQNCNKTTKRSKQRWMCSWMLIFFTMFCGQSVNILFDRPSSHPNKQTKTTGEKVNWWSNTEFETKTDTYNTKIQFEQKTINCNYSYK